MRQHLVNQGAALALAVTIHSGDPRVVAIRGILDDCKFGRGLVESLSSTSAPSAEPVVLHFCFEDIVFDSDTVFVGAGHSALTLAPWSCPTLDSCFSFDFCVDFVILGRTPQNGCCVSVANASCATAGGLQRSVGRFCFGKKRQNSTACLLRAWMLRAEFP
jgi:hypothetical protein